MNTLSKQTTLYRAPWLVPVTAPVIADGGVLVGDGRILAAGSFGSLRQGADRVVELDGVLLPRLINCHSHLELAVYGDSFAALLAEEPPDTFPGWIGKLLQQRADTAFDAASRQQEAQKLLRRMARQGVALVLDTGNLFESAGLGVNLPVAQHFLLELLGISEAAAALKSAELEGLAEGISVTAHAPYSTHAALLQKIKARCVKNGQLFSIHTAESLEESEFLQAGTGPMTDFLAERGVLDGAFQTPGCGPVQYLDRLGLLDNKTLCVHCVQVTAEDIDTLARHGAGVCLCPESNRTLRVGTAPVMKMIETGIRLCLGTDSPASNPHCSMWREMQILSLGHAALEPEKILAMATIGGAAALGIDDDLGSLEAGKRDAMILVRQNFSSPRQLMETLVASGQGLKIETIGVDL